MLEIMDAGIFAARMKELRRAAGLTQPELASKTGLSKSYVADLEQGRYEPSWSTVLAMATALGVKCDAFTEPPASSEPQGRGRPSSKSTDDSKPESGKPKKGKR